jgi:hypothetical protein
MADKPVTLEHIINIIVCDDVRRAFGGPAPIADPRECPGCVHHRTAHTSWGCDHCMCGVSIVDLTPTRRAA